MTTAKENGIKIDQHGRDIGELKTQAAQMKNEQQKTDSELATFKAELSHTSKSVSRIEKYALGGRLTLLAGLIAGLAKGTGFLGCIMSGIY